MAWRLGRPYSLFCCRPARLTVLLARHPLPYSWSRPFLAILTLSGCVPSGTVQGSTVEYARAEAPP